MVLKVLWFSFRFPGVSLDRILFPGASRSTLLTFSMRLQHLLTPALFPHHALEKESERVQILNEFRFA